VDVQEVKKLDAYLKKLFGNQRLRVVPKKADEADVFVGEERVGGLTVDDEDEERSYNLEMKITLGRPRTSRISRRSKPICGASSTPSAFAWWRAAQDRLRRGLYRRGIYWRPVLRQEGDPILLFRDGDSRARSEEAGLGRSI